MRFGKATVSNQPDFLNGHRVIKLSKERHSGIELLRIYAIIGVIIVHYFNGGIGGGSSYVSGTLSVFVYRLFLTLSFCAVDLFVMISAFFLSVSEKRSFSKIFFLLFEAGLLRCLIYIIQAWNNDYTITVAGIVISIFSFGYFIVFYSIIYLLSPLINIGFGRLNGKNAQKAVTILFVLFSVIPSFAVILREYNVCNSDWTAISTVTIKGSFEGYTIVNFFLCYLIGWYIRHWYNEKAQKRTNHLLLGLNTIALLVWGYINWQSAYTYDNPLVILEAAWLLAVFKDLKIQSRFINEIASSGFTCYLLNGVFIKYLSIERFASKSWYVLLAHVMLSVVGIYLLCYVIHKVYKLCTGWLEYRLSAVIDRIDLTFYSE